MKNLRKNLQKLLIVSCLTFCIINQTSPTAYAESEIETHSSVAELAAKEVKKANPDLANDMVRIRPKGGKVLTIEGSVSNTNFRISKSPSEEISVTNGGNLVSVGLPFSEKASDASVTRDGVAVYDNNNGSLTVPLARKDGSLQINTVISSPRAPKEYPYQFELPEGTTIFTEGEILLFLKEGKLIGGLAPAWAKDAKGKNVPTRYSVRGSTVTQVVEHGSKFTYPVVADPWLGFNLFNALEVNRNGKVKGENVYSGTLSGWGIAVYSGVAQGGGIAGVFLGYKIIRSYGWDEWKSRLLGSAATISLEQQYVCHARFGYAFWKSGFHWDLEAARPSKPDWTKDPFSHKCNW